jgi:hypothetical protein
MRKIGFPINDIGTGKQGGTVDETTRGPTLFA